jgi:IS5 family transposase
MHCNPDVRIVHRGKSKRLSAQERKLLERRQAIEPIIGHLKADHRMDRCHLKGERVTGCMPCCAQQATTSAGCCA